MKKSFRKGERILAEVVESLSTTEIICSLEGTLFRIRNESGRVLKKGDKALLEVTQATPLQFKTPTTKNLDRVI